MDSQKWQSVPIDMGSIPLEELEMLGGGLEELTDYEIVKSDSKTKAKKRKKEKGNNNKAKKTKTKLKSEDDDSLEDKINEDDEVDMSAWGNYLHDSLLKGLRMLNFQKPTKIQELTIPVAMRGNQDILGAAETGSGKTLAFGIPIINKIISIKERKKVGENEEFSKPLYCLVVTPTRELAIQIKNHLQAVCKFTDIRISVLVGGMASEKQKRILKKCPEIVVATPGRLWEMIEEGESHLSKVSNIRYLVIDETDRMLEKGHFAELTQILSLVNSNPDRKRQTFVFSATLTMIHDAPKRLILKKKKVKVIQAKQKLESFVKLIGMKEPKVFDITKKTAVVDTLTETQILCNNEEKDSYLYYFLLMHPGRTLVFCNSIDCVRRLRNILELLECHPLSSLHASMQQRQRLKNLERFEQSDHGILLATDVAARGLDIKRIEHVIHFQVPHTAETYVHRSGRTARAENEGLSLLLISPHEGTQYKRMCKTLNKEQVLPTFPTNYKIFKLIKERVTLAHSIAQLEHKLTRRNAENCWLQNTAKEMDVAIDDNLLNDMGDQQEQAAKSRYMKAMKKQLKSMLSKPISSKIFTGSYPTKSGKLISPSTYSSQKAITVVKKKLAKV